MYKDADKIKYLELIENNILRFSNISTLIKGWFVTTFVVLLSPYTNTLNLNGVFFHSVGGIFLVTFIYFFDTYFLYQEKLYRDLYDKVRKGKICNSEYFNLNPKCFINGYVLFFKALKSCPQVLFYGFFVAFIAIWANCFGVVTCQ